MHHDKYGNELVSLFPPQQYSLSSEHNYDTNPSTQTALWELASKFHLAQ